MRAVGSSGCIAADSGFDPDAWLLHAPDHLDPDGLINPDQFGTGTMQNGGIGWKQQIAVATGISSNVAA